MEKQPAGNENRASLWIADNDKPIVDYGPRRKEIDEYLKENAGKPLSERPDIKLGYYPADGNGDRKQFMGKIAMFVPDQTMPTTDLGPHLSRWAPQSMTGRGMLYIQTDLEIEMKSQSRRWGDTRHSVGKQAVIMSLHYNNYQGKSYSGDINDDIEELALLDQPAEVPDIYHSDGNGGFYPLEPEESDELDNIEALEKSGDANDNVLAA